MRFDFTTKPGDNGCSAEVALYFALKDFTGDTTGSACWDMIDRLCNTASALRSENNGKISQVIWHLYNTDVSRLSMADRVALTSISERLIEENMTAYNEAMANAEDEAG